MRKKNKRNYNKDIEILKIAKDNIIGESLNDILERELNKRKKVKTLQLEIPNKVKSDLK